MESREIADLEDIVVRTIMDITLRSSGMIASRRDGARAWSAWVELDRSVRGTDRVRRMCLAHGTTKGRAERACLAEALRWIAGVVAPKPSRRAAEVK